MVATSCLLPNRASFAPACLSHEIIIRRSVSPSLGTARVCAFAPNICSPDPLACHLPPLALYKGLPSKAFSASCVVRTQMQPCLQW